MDCGKPHGEAASSDAQHFDRVFILLTVFLLFAFGCAGALARYGLSSMFNEGSWLRWDVIIANGAGCFAFGVIWPFLEGNGKIRKLGHVGLLAGPLFNQQQLVLIFHATK